MKTNHFRLINKFLSGLKPFSVVAFITPALRPGLVTEISLRWALAQVSRTRINKNIVRVTALFLLLTITINATAQKKKKLVWSDEFNTNGLPDTTKWGYDLGRGCPDNCGWGNN
jgi:hypothetical protein